MNAVRLPDLAVLLFTLLVCAVFGGLFAFVLALPFWLGFAMVGAALLAQALARNGGGRTPRRRAAALVRP
ncbi:MAG TPA: hypothetical protein DCM32_01470 [Xanthomonadaceae bacterium]|nr:hypothetical protein [Xanthomonadaceae bacterium]